VAFGSKGAHIMLKAFTARFQKESRPHIEGILINTMAHRVKIIDDLAYILGTMNVGSIMGPIDHKNPSIHELAIRRCEEIYPHTSYCILSGNETPQQYIIRRC
jgi:hypothetical protein